MATSFGGTGSFYNPNNWDPVGVPQPGDPAIVQTGTVKVNNQTNDATFWLEGQSKATQSVLQLTNHAMQGDIAAVGSGGPNPGKINISGDVSSSGEINAGAAHVYAGSLTIHIAQQSTFENTGFYWYGRPTVYKWRTSKSTALAKTLPDPPSPSPTEARDKRIRKRTIRRG